MEADALGSQLAMRALLVYLGKKAVIVTSDKVPAEYNFIPQVKYIRKPQDIKNEEFDCLVALDCSDAARCREVFNLFSKKKIIINIDHHISNCRFGDVNWVDANASSTVEMIYRLYKYMRLPLDKNKALFLYAGLVTDTGSFRYPNTTSESHRMAAELLSYVIKVNKIYRNIYESLKFSDLKLINKVLLTLNQDKTGKVIWFEIRKELLKPKELSFDLTEKVLNFGRLNRYAEVIVLFKEDLNTNNQIRVNFRSRGNIDVNKIAESFGGGGHKNASGCRIKGRLETVREIVLKKVRESLR
jgi:phosphoesterase RecJ-like protein